MVELGNKVKDLISGFGGIAVGRIEYLYGCSQIQIEPDRLDKDGKHVDARWFDEQRVEVLKPMVAVISPDSRPSAEIPGGDRDDKPDPANNRP
jgi:hypothetical protein